MRLWTTLEEKESNNLTSNIQQRNSFDERESVVPLTNIGSLVRISYVSGLTGVGNGATKRHLLYLYALVNDRNYSSLNEIFVYYYYLLCGECCWEYLVIFLYKWLRNFLFFIFIVSNVERWRMAQENLIR